MVQVCDGYYLKTDNLIRAYTSNVSAYTKSNFQNESRQVIGYYLI